MSALVCRQPSPVTQLSQDRACNQRVPSILQCSFRHKKLSLFSKLGNACKINVNQEC